VAICGKSPGLRQTERLLLGRLYHVTKRAVEDVAKFVLGIDEVVAGEDIAIVLYGERLSAILKKHA
jgi:hypothetical protein